MGEGQLAVDGDRVVKRAEQGPPVVEHTEQSRAQRLVVVNDVERAAPRGENPSRAQ